MELRLLGPVQLEIDGRAVAPSAAKQRALLGLLGLHANDVVTSDRVVDEIWGERPPASAHKLVQTYVWQLRKLLGDALRTSPSGYELALPAERIDSCRFERLTERGQELLDAGDAEGADDTLAQALALWRGPALSDVELLGFARREADRMDELRLVAQEASFEARLLLGRHPEVVPELERLAQDEPYRERLHGQLMLALYRCGRQAEALETYMQLHRTLRDDLGLEPTPRLHELQQAILRHDASLAPVPLQRRSGIPVPPDRLVGRAQELAAVEDLLRRVDVRLVTLTGAGGTGKTRLAIEAAHAVGGFEDGTFFVDLSPLVDPARVVPTLAHSIGFREHGDAPPIETLGRFLDDKHVLVLLDNFEHVSAAAAEVAALLDAAAHLKVLVTSRVALRVAGECELSVPPLDEPDAAALFVARAQAASVDFEPDDKVATICRRIDCLPLAIELAAARVKVLSLGQILERLEKRLPLLAGGPRDAPDRHRTLRATIEWSYQLLDPPEQMLFARLGVFVGGFSFEAAESVCDADVDLLTSLLDNNLVRRRSDVLGEPRFAMLETIREYAREKLEASGAAEATSRRHADHFLVLAERAEPELESGDAPGWLDRLASEIGNIRAALAYLSSEEADVGVRLAVALRKFWLERGDLAEGRAWLERALAASPDGAGALRVKALEGAAFVVRRQGDNQRAKALAEERLAFARELGDGDAIAASFHQLGLLAADAGDHERARALYEEAVRLGRLAGHRSLALWITDLGSLARWEGDVARASALLEEALAMHREADDKSGVAYALEELALVALREGRSRTARSLLAESLRLWHAAGATNLIVQGALDSHAAAIAAQGDAERAAQLLGSAEALRESMGIRPLFQEKTESPRNLAAAAARDQVGDDAFAEAFARGRTLSLDQAVALALETHDCEPSSDVAGNAQPKLALPVHGA
jgi:predicted ATPase/DNA-binding SARP family transcriptional activator